MYQNKVKMVIIINNSLGMKKGKMISQACHSAVGLTTYLLETNQRDILKQWKENLETTIVVKCDSEIELLEYYHKSKKIGLESVYMIDAGLTQVPVGSKTTLAILGNSLDIDKITGHLRLV